MDQESKYTHLQLEFEQGYINKKWKSITQFAIAKGITYKNGGWKRATKGWKQKAEKLIEDLPKAAQDKAKEEFIERAKKDWEIIYKSLGEASTIMAEKIKGFAERTDFTYIDTKDNERLDIAAIKGLMDAGISAATLHKKTYIKDDIPLSAESNQKIAEAKIIKQDEKAQEVEDPLKGKTVQEIELEIAKLDD